MISLTWPLFETASVANVFTLPIFQLEPLREDTLMRHLFLASWAALSLTVAIAENQVDERNHANHSAETLKSSPGHNDHEVDHAKTPDNEERGHDHANHDDHAKATDADAPDGHEIHKGDQPASPDVDEHGHYDHVKTAGADGHDHDHESHSVEGAVLAVTPEQRKLIGLKVNRARTGTIDDLVRLTGELRLNADRVAQVMPRMPGFVIEIKKNVGDDVKEGDALAVMRSHQLGELFGDYYSISEQVKLAKSEYDRQTKLLENDATSERNYLAAKHAYATLKFELHRAEEKLKALGFLSDSASEGRACECATGEDEASEENCTVLTIHSPIDGTIIEKDITLGENFPEDNEKVVFVVADLSKVWLDLRAHQKDLPFLRRGQKATVKIGRGYEDREGVVSYVAPVVSRQTRTALIRLVLDNGDGELRPGLFATASIDVGTSAATVVIDASAVQRLGDVTIVFAPENDGFAPKPVTTGRSGNGQIEIVAGLRDGDRYVSSGAFELKAILATSGLDPHAGHGH